MGTVANVLVGLMAALQFYFLVLEMFLWNRPSGRRTFGLSESFAAESRVLAANQGLYNGFLSAGLVWGLLLGHDGVGVRIFFLACVVVAGVFGGATASKKILLAQALPGALAFIAVCLAA
jgi:putative membrane protein